MLVLIYSPPAPDSCSSPLGLVFPRYEQPKLFGAYFDFKALHYTSPIGALFGCLTQGWPEVASCLMIDLD